MTGTMNMHDGDLSQRTRWVAGVILALLMLPAGTALAQGPDHSTPLRVRLGPFFITPTLLARDIGVDTNVYNESQTEPIHDFTFTIVPTFTAVVGPRRVNLTLRSSNEFVYFAKQTSERSINGVYSASVRTALRRISPFAEVGYVNTRERVSGEIDARARRNEKRAAGGLNIALTPKVQAVVRGDISRMAFADDATFDNEDLAQQLDRETKGVSASLRYIATPLVSVSVTSEVATSRFEQDPLRNSDWEQTFVGVDLNPRALISGSARVGYQSFGPLNSTVPDFSGVIGSGNVTYRMGPSSSLGVLYDRIVEFSYLPEEPYYIREGIGLSLQRKLVPQWDVTVSGERDWHRYRHTGFGEGDAALGHSDRLLSASLYVGYDVGRRTRIMTGVSYQDRNSDIAERSYNGFHVGTSIAYGF